MAFNKSPVRFQFGFAGNIFCGKPENIKDELLNLKGLEVEDAASPPRNTKNSNKKMKRKKNKRKWY